MILSVCSLLIFKNSCFAAEQEIKFEILDVGDVSGYGEEAYLVVVSEADWINIWKKHTSICEPQEQPQEIDFTKNFVICAFMGRRPTTGYSINIERIWTDGEKVFVEVVKRCPPQGLVVCEMVTCPYVMVLVERTEMTFVFQVANEDGETAEYGMGEFPSVNIAFLIFLFLLLAVAALKIKKKIKENIISF
jgi:hypothetical protein